MWLLRQQQYPLPPLISYKIPRIRVLCRFGGQFLNRSEGVDLSGNPGHDMSIGNAPHASPLFHRQCQT